MATAANEGTQGITAIATTANIAMITAMTTLAITGMDAHASIHESVLSYRDALESTRFPAVRIEIQAR
jgi:hypothetical protein